MKLDTAYWRLLINVISTFNNQVFIYNWYNCRKNFAILWYMKYNDNCLRTGNRRKFPYLDQMCPKTSKGYVLSQPWLISKTSSCILSPSHLLLITKDYYPNWIFILLPFPFSFANPNLQVIARSTSGVEWIQHRKCLLKYRPNRTSPLFESGMKYWFLLKVPNECKG